MSDERCVCLQGLPCFADEHDEPRDPRHRPTSYVPQAQPAPIDWPARFRAAAKAADRAGWIGIGADLQDLAFRIEVRHMPTDVVESIVQALLGRSS